MVNENDFINLEFQVSLIIHHIIFFPKHIVTL